MKISSRPYTISFKPRGGIWSHVPHGSFKLEGAIAKTKELFERQDMTSITIHKTASDPSPKRNES